MAATAATLRTLHRIHVQLAELRDRLDRGPRQIALRQQNVAAREADLQAAHEAVKQVKLRVDGQQLDLKASEQRIVDWNAKLNACSSNKEFQTLKEQIAAAEMATSVLSDEILENLERIDNLGEKVVKAESDLKATEEELAKITEKVEASAEVIRGDIERLEVDLAEAEKGIPADFRTEYDRVINHKGAEGMSEVEDGVCNGCGQKITPNMHNALLMSRPTFCGSCGRLLYIPE
ncbi:zinc ribbon domain-containing protein [Aeoliella mucimassa]|uniref:Zinc ribbon domain protein n=1 Tax=Aeoliella mucimassa TaxID=2527972 RepID=A0A518AQR6_9BACT|nr:phospholipase [Aeoliella mucimassa]QDU57068.1 Putative zinc ribbon domain protein [Aeoliella mucimassa]